MRDTTADRQAIVSCTVQQRLSNGEAAAILVMSGPRSAWSRASGSPYCAPPVRCCHNRAVLLYEAIGTTRTMAASWGRTAQQDHTRSLTPAAAVNFLFVLSPHSYVLTLTHSDYKQVVACSRSQRAGSYTLLALWGNEIHNRDIFVWW